MGGYRWREPEVCFLGARPAAGGAAGGQAGGDAPRGDVLLVGLPFDLGSSYRAGSAGGPAAVRAASQVLEEYSLATGGDLCSLVLVDAGDLVACDCAAAGGSGVAGGGRAPGAAGAGQAPGAKRVGPCRGWPAKAAESLRAACRDLLAADGLLAVIGGDHSVSAVAAAAVAGWLAGEGGERCAGRRSGLSGGCLAVLVLDAHADLRDCYEGSRWSHGCAAARLLDVVGPGFLQQAGVRSADRVEVATAVRLGLYWAGDADGGRAPRLAEDALAALDLLPDDVPLYLSVDLDVADPACAPGVGAPEPGGCSARELLEAVVAVSRRAGRRLVALDVTEVTPSADHGGITAVLAAKLVREAVLASPGRGGV